MTTPEASLHTDAWVWPPRVPAPGACDQLRAGDLPIRHPGPAAIAPTTLVASLRDSRPALATIPTNELVRILGAAAETLTRELGRAGILDVAANGRLSTGMARAVVTGMAASWNTAALGHLVRAEFPDPGVLDGFVAETGRRARAAAPPVTLHFGAGSVPGVTVTSMIRALLVRSAVLAKPGAGDIALTVRFARLLHRADPRLASAVAVQYWPGGSPRWDRWESDLLRAADQVVVYGSDATIESVRARAPASTRLIEHPHRAGVAIVDPRTAPGAAAAAARAAALFEQRGCVSTHLVLLLGGQDTAEPWCTELAASLAAAEAELCSGPRTPGELSALHQLRGSLAMKAAARNTPRTSSPAREAFRLWSTDGHSWSVVLAPPDAIEPEGGRTVRVVPVGSRAACLEILAPLSPVLQTVGLAGIDRDRTAFAEDLFALGATRIVPLDQVPFPEADWLHDGRRPLRELVCWGELR